MVLIVCTSSDDVLYFYEVSWKYPDPFLIYRADTQLLLWNFQLQKYTRGPRATGRSPDDDLFISCDDRIGKMLHNICISAVAVYIFPILSSQLMKRSSFKQFFILKKNIYDMTVNRAWSFEQTLNHISTVGSMWNLVANGSGFWRITILYM